MTDSAAEQRREEVRSDFIALCVDFAPPHKKRERELKAGAEFDRLLATGKFDRLVVHQKSLLARSRMVRMHKYGKHHRIGVFMLEITSKDFCAFNLTHQIDGYHGPHINPSGMFCMTSGRAEILQDICSGLLADALITIEAALWLDGPGAAFLQASIENWPLDPGE